MIISRRRFEQELDRAYDRGCREWIIRCEDNRRLSKRIGLIAAAVEEMTGKEIPGLKETYAYPF